MRITRNSDTVVVELSSEAETDRLGFALAAIATPNTVIGLIGALGAGKTRLSRAIAIGLGVDPGAISSPTFVHIHEYEGSVPFYHFDAYRLGGSEPFEALGVADYWEIGGVCLVEWADLVSDRLPETSWYVTLAVPSETSRQVTITGPDPARLEHFLEQNRPKV